MNTAIRTVAAALALFVCASSALAATTYPTAADRAFAKKLFAPVLAGLHKSGVVVLLPGALPASDMEGVRAELESAGPAGYSIDLNFTPGCSGGACYLGNIAGRRSDGSKPAGKRVRLLNGTTGYFVLGPCGASCSDSTITFDVGSARYVFAEKGATLETLSQWTASIVEAKK